MASSMGAPCVALAALLLSTSCGGVQGSVAVLPVPGHVPPVLLARRSETSARPGLGAFSPAAIKPRRAVVVNEPGATVDLTTVAVPGHVTVVAFGADWCRPCKRLEARLLEVASKHPDVVVRVVDIGADVTSPVARQHHIQDVPSVFVFDATGALRYRLDGKDSHQAAEIATHLASATGEPVSVRKSAGGATKGS